MFTAQVVAVMSGTSRLVVPSPLTVPPRPAATVAGCRPDVRRTVVRVNSTPDLTVERALLSRSGRTLLVALDEVGRGAVAGPVTVGAVALGPDTPEAPVGVRDSKTLSAAARQRLLEPIGVWALSCAVGHCTPEQIDRDGIVSALGTAAARALLGVAGQLGERWRPDQVVVLLDGDTDVLAGRVRADIEVVCRVKADRDCASVAAASIVAKCDRDAVMRVLHTQAPVYGFDRHKGYLSPQHHDALETFGPTRWHRLSWKLPERRAPQAPAEL
jgi:ribonuclease HII